MDQYCTPGLPLPVLIHTLFQLKIIIVCPCILVQYIYYSIYYKLGRVPSFLSP
jgi:hypothetical protein